MRHSDAYGVKFTKSWGEMAKTFPYHIEVEFSDKDTFYKMESGDTPHTLANRHYGDEHLWWIIMVANKDKGYRTEWDVAIGDTLRVPFNITPYLSKIREYYKKEDI